MARVPKSRKAREKGASREAKFRRAFTKYPLLTIRDMPLWYQGIRKGTKREDHCGGDFFIITSYGEIGVDVKSSPGGVDGSLTKDRPDRGNIVYVPVGNDLDHAQNIRLRALSAIEKKFGKGLWKLAKIELREIAKTATAAV
jgi:hypothetical protein